MTTERKKIPKLRPRNTPDLRHKHGIIALDTLLKSNIDRRLSIARKRDALEAQLIDRAGGLDNVTSSMLLLIKRIIHKALICAQAEKMSMLGEYDLMDKRYVCLSNSLRLDIQAFEGMIKTDRRNEYRQSKKL